MAIRRSANPLPVLAILGEICKIMAFPLYFKSSLLCSIKEPGIQTARRWLLRYISLPSSPSAGFPNKAIFLASTPYLPDSLAYPVRKQRELGLSNKVAKEVFTRLAGWVR